MKYIQYFLILIVVFYMSGCHDNDETDNITWNQEALLLIKDGISADYNKADMTLKFTASYSDVSVLSDVSWIEATVAVTDGIGELNIQLFENSDILNRQGTVTLLAQGNKTIIHITQRGFPHVIPENDSYYHSCESGEITVKVKAGSLPTVETFPKDIEWIAVRQISSVGENEYAITLTVDKNESLGRIASLRFNIDGRSANATCSPCIIQEPAPLAEHVDISIDKPGMLPVLLGNNAGNIANIRLLKISGAVNRIDLPVIARIFTADDDSFAERPIAIDLSDCAFVAGEKNPLEFYGWKPTEIYGDVTLSAMIPRDVFTNAANLSEIVLPESLTEIGASAFAGCKNLKTIRIPRLVETIGSKAFYGCSSLKEIEISDDSNLNSVGNQAFTTGSLLSNLTIPAGAINISSETFLGCEVTRLHLKWPEPIVVKIVPKTDGCTLLVPKGTADMYRTVQNWCYFNEIIEE